MTRNGWPVWVALAAGLVTNPARAEPPAEVETFPIPTGTAEGGTYAVFEWAWAGGNGLSVARRDEEGGWRVWPVAGRTAGGHVQTPLFQTDYSRTSLLAGLRPLGLGVQHELFLHNEWSVEVETGVAELAARLQWFPIEGVTLGLGLDTRRGLVARCRLGF